MGKNKILTEANQYDILLKKLRNGGAKSIMITARELDLFKHQIRQFDDYRAFKAHPLANGDTLYTYGRE